MYLLAASGALRTILVLLIAWLVLRMWMRMQQAPGPGGPSNGPERPSRPKGDVRIEQVTPRKPGAPLADVQDADFEEIK